MSIFDHVGRATSDVWVTLGDGSGAPRVDDLHVWVTLPDGRVTRAMLDVQDTSSEGMALPDDRMPLEGTILLAEPMGNKYPDSDNLMIVVNTLYPITPTVPPVTP